MEILQYAVEHGCPWARDTTLRAARYGKLACLQYSHQHNCPWDPSTTYAAALKGQLACLSYIYENCGDVATWEISGLDDYDDNAAIPAHIKEYLWTVEYNWKNGSNMSTSVKPARRSK